MQAIQTYKAAPLFDYDPSDFENAIGTKRQVTAEYVAQLMLAMNDPSTKNVQGLPAPMTTHNSVIYTGSGSRSHITTSNTTRVVVFFDPEVSLRTGQCRAILVEYSNGGAVLSQTSIDCGRSSSSYTAAGVIFSALSVSNGSSLNELSGQQTQAVVYTLPKTQFDHTQSSLGNLVMRRHADMVTSHCAEGGTRSFAPSEHIGNNITVCNDVYTRTSEMRSYYRLSTEEPATGFNAVNVAAFSGISTTIWDSKLVTSPQQLTLPNGDLKSGAYGFDLSLTFRISDTSVIVASNESFLFTVMAYDHAGGLLVGENLANSVPAAATSANKATLNMTVSKYVSTPIARIVIMVANTSGVASGASYDYASVTLQLINETGDIPCRPIHYCVMEGLNPSASINVRTDALFSAIPSEDNVSLATFPASMSNLDDSMIKVMFRSMFSTFSRACLISESAKRSQLLLDASPYLVENLAQASTEPEMAMSFHEALKLAGRHASRTAKTAAPLLKAYGDSGLPGADAAKVTLTGIRTAQKLGILKSA